MTPIRAMSYNVRYDTRHDHHDAWYARRDGVVDLVRFHRPDVVGFQEPLPEQRRELRERLDGYELVGRGRLADGDGEGNPIAVRRDRWSIVDSDTFWLSETPAEPSTDWGAAHPRIATWARIEPRHVGEDTGEDTNGDPGRGLLLVNTHLDHESALARENAARLIRRRIPDLLESVDVESVDVESVDGEAGDGEAGNGEVDDGDDPAVVVVGDFNCPVNSPPYRVLTGSDGAGVDLTDAEARADIRHGPTTSVTDYSELIADRRIDHVLVSPDVDAEAFATLADRDDRGRYPSDHLPVLARLRI